MSKLLVHIEESEIHSWIRALEDAGCHEKAGKLRAVAKCPHPYCIEHGKKAS